MNRRQTIWRMGCLLLAVAALYCFMCSKKKEALATTLPPLRLQGSTEMSYGALNCKIWDNETEDGDTVAILLDGTLIKDTFELLNRPLELPLGKLSKGKHLFVVTAVSEGMNAPATASIGLSNGKDSSAFIMNATKDTAASWTIVIK